jgi:hypothetical protein
MSEEQANFKVTDRRLFNADGTPRDVPEEQQAQKTETPASEPTSPSVPATAPEPDDFDEPGEAIPDADDPASFANFLVSIASNAASALGMMEHPVTHQREVDLELGKHWIDVLGMLQTKTKGNLSAPESQLLDSLLRDLRMQFVSLTNKPPKAAGGFTGKDILGG